jgi:hypothetical protein
MWLRRKLEFHGSTATGDAGLLTDGKFDDARVLHNTRTGRTPKHTPTALLRQSINSRLARSRWTSMLVNLHRPGRLNVIKNGKLRE